MKSLLEMLEASLCQRLRAFSLLTMVIACSPAELQDSQDPMAPGTNDAGVQLGDCAPCFDVTCAWETIECTADPACSTWLTCARQCPQDASGSVQETCLSRCPTPPAGSGSLRRDRLQACILNAASCCDSARASAVDAGITEDGDRPRLTCAEGCSECLAAIKANSDGCTDDACSTTMADCYHENNGSPGVCWTFLASYGACAQKEDLGRGDVDSCVQVIPEQSLRLTYAAWTCAAWHCPGCERDQNTACLSCRLQACPDGMEAFLESESAQTLWWWLKACGTDAACTAQASRQHQDGQEILQELDRCSRAACAEPCDIR